MARSSQSGGQFSVTENSFQQSFLSWGMLWGHGISEVCKDDPGIKACMIYWVLGTWSSAGLLTQALLSLFYSSGKRQNLFVTFMFVCVCVCNHDQT